VLSVKNNFFLAMDKNGFVLSEKNYKEIFHNSPVAKLILSVTAPGYNILDANDAYLSATNSKREDIVGKSVFAAFPGNPSDSESKNIERTVYSFEQAIKTKKRHTMSNYRYDIPIAGTTDFEERYWTTTNIPVLDDNGEAAFLIHCPENVTEINKLAERERLGIEALKMQRAQLLSTFMQAPVAIAIFTGADYVVELINPPMCELYGKTMDELMGKPIFEVLTDAKGKGFEELLDNVRLTGVSFRGDSMPLPIMRNHILEDVYFDFVYEPFKDEHGNITGVIAVATEITARVKANIKVHEAEERARLAVEAVGSGTFDLDWETGELVASQRFAEIFGFDHPVPRSYYVDTFHPDDIMIRTMAHNEVLKTGSLQYEARIYWPDKSLHWIRVDGKLFYDTNHKPSRIIGIVHDITEQRKAAEEQKKLITLVNNSVDLMSILELDGTNSYINEAGKKLLGIDKNADIRKIKISKLHDPADYVMVEKEVIPSVMEKGKWAGVMKVKNYSTNEVFPVYNSTTRIDDPVSGKPIAIGAVMRDMRPELQAKEALEESEGFLRTITTATPTGLWMSDEEGNITYVNQTWIDWTGIPFEKHLGSDWMNVILEQDLKQVIEKFKASMQARISGEAEFRMKKSDGNIHWYMATGKPQFKDGVFSGYIGACVDITEQKQVQIQKDNFIAIASHELKTPVTSIKAYSQVLEMIMNEKGNKHEAAMVTKMDSQLNRLIDLINDLLDVTKINAGKLQFNDVEFEINAMVEEWIEDLQRTSSSHRIVVFSDGKGIVLADKERIGQVLTNFITNAIKYSPNNNKIKVHTTVKDGEAIVGVEDFGIGITQDNQAKVFEQFYRVNGDMQHTFPGLGIGLYISSEIIKREGGKIWVESVPGKGSHFFFSLPLITKQPH
jgi:PAS domain S-box-containing protein